MNTGSDQSSHGRPEDAPPDRARRTARRLFDIRSMIGGILLVYGVVLALVGIFDGPHAISQATGIRINLWTGLSMIVIGALFLLWERFGGDDSRTAEPREDLVEDPKDPT